MTENLRYTLEPNSNYIGSYNNGETFTFSSDESCETNGACIMNGNTAVESSGGSYDGYHYYSWYAATAGKGLPETTGDVDGSVCPSGWKLPYGYSNIASHDKTYGLLTDIYGLTTDATTVNNESGFYILQDKPFDFALSGGFDGRGHAVNAGIRGAYWQSSAYDATRGKRLIFWNPTLGPQGNNYKYVGMAIRCVSL